MFSSPSRALLRRQETNPEVGVQALLARAHLEQPVAQVSRAFGEQPRSLSDDAALRGCRVLDRADDAGDVDPDVLLPGDVETGDPDPLEVLPERRPAHLQNAAEHTQVRATTPVRGRFAAAGLVVGRGGAADGQEED